MLRLETLAHPLICSALLIPLACVTPSSSDGDVPDEWIDLIEPVAGERLRPVLRTAEDGTLFQIGWHDTSFDTPCAFSPTPDAGLRCVPTTLGDDVWLYADANCTEPVMPDIWIPEGATMVRTRGDGCFDHSYYEVGEEVDEIYVAANGLCEFFSNDPSHRVTLIPHEQFVAATLTPQQGQSRIVPLLLQADDGAQQIFGAWDRVHEEEVTPALDATQQLRWFGRWEPRVSTIYFADADCTERVAVAECVPDSEQPMTAKETEAGDSAAVLDRHELLEEVDQLYFANDGNCSPTSLAGHDTHAWRVGAPLDDDDFAVGSIIDGGGARLRLDVYTGPEGEPFLASDRVYDGQDSEIACRWIDPLTSSSAPSASATFDCVPVDAAQFSSRFQDSACSQRTASRFVFEAARPSEVRYAYGQSMVAAITGPIAAEGGYGLDDQGACVPLPPSEPPDGGEYEYYLVDDAMVQVAHAVDVIE